VNKPEGDKAEKPKEIENLHLIPDQDHALNEIKRENLMRRNL